MIKKKQLLRILIQIEANQNKLIDLEKNQLLHVGGKHDLEIREKLQAIYDYLGVKETIKKEIETSPQIITRYGITASWGSYYEKQPEIDTIKKTLVLVKNKKK